MSKYTLEEKPTARRIQDLKSMQYRLRRQWLDIDVKINALNAQIGHKYGNI